MAGNITKRLTRDFGQLIPPNKKTPKREGRRRRRSSIHLLSTALEDNNNNSNKKSNNTFLMIRRVGSADSPLIKLKPTTDIVNPQGQLNLLPLRVNNSQDEADDSKKHHRRQSSNAMKTLTAMKGYMNSTRLMVLVVLCLQNSLFTTLRRYSQGVLKENYSKYELLLLAEIIKILYSAWMIQKNMLTEESSSNNDDNPIPRHKTLSGRLTYLVETSKKMFVLALIYGAMNILSFISLRNISAGIFTIFAQTKILTTATFSTIMLRRQYSWTKWRALVGLMMGVLLFSEPIWNSESDNKNDAIGGNAFLGTVAVLIEVSLSGFASIYFEKVIKTDPLQLGIWERNFQLALGSIPVYVLFIVANGGGTAGFFQGWSAMAILLAGLGAAGGLLVALSIKHGDSILKTLATTGAIVLTGCLDFWFLEGPMTPSMVIAGVMVIISICNYTFDATPSMEVSESSSPSKLSKPASRNLLVASEDDLRSGSNHETERLMRKV